MDERGQPISGGRALRNRDLDKRVEGPRCWPPRAPKRQRRPSRPRAPTWAMSSGRGSLLHVFIMEMVIGPINNIVVTLSRNALTKPAVCVRVRVRVRACVCVCRAYAACAHT